MTRLDHFKDIAGRVAAYPDRLARALVPFALVCVGIVGLRGRELARARRRNRAVAVKLALLGDAEAVAALRERLGGLRALLAWERRARWRVEHMSWRARQSAFRAAIHGAPRVPEREAAESAAACSGEVPCGRAECADVFCRLLRDAQGLERDGTEGVGDVAGTAGRQAECRGPGARYGFALPALPGVPGRAEARAGAGTRRASRRRRAVVRVWPCELMSAAENAREDARRARRETDLAARRTHVEAALREARARCLQELDNAARGVSRGSADWVAQRRAEDEARLAALRARDAERAEAGRVPDD